MFNALRHLLPDGTAWRVVVDKLLRRYLEGVSSVATDARVFIDEVAEDMVPDSTRELAEWQDQFALFKVGDEAAQRNGLGAAWQANGGQSPRYLQDIMQAAGFPVYVHDWWNEPGLDAKDPRDHTNQPTIGTYQCGDPDSYCASLPGVAHCNRFLANEIWYLVNKTLSQDAPEAVPDDPDYWPHFVYWGGETFPDRVTIAAEERDRFEALLLKYNPTEKWLVTLIDIGTPVATGAISIDPGVDVGQEWSILPGGYFGTASQGPRTLAAVPVGAYTLTWSDVAGYDEPVPKTVPITVTEGGTFDVTPPVYDLTVVPSGTINVDPGTDVGQVWLILPGGYGGLGSQGPRALPDIPVGDYELSWSNVAGYLEPVPKTVLFTLIDGATVNIPPPVYTLEDPPGFLIVEFE